MQRENPVAECSEHIEDQQEPVDTLLAAEPALTELILLNEARHNVGYLPVFEGKMPIGNVVESIFEKTANCLDPDDDEDLS
jgi:hypothetical protein